MSPLASQPGPPEPLAAPAGEQERRLLALSEVAASVAGAHELTDVLEVAAEATRRVLGVSSLSISRWELEHARLRTLVNVGDLAAGEERWPVDETYAIADFPKAHALLRRGEPHVTAIDDPAADAAERRLLRELGGTSCAAVPVVYEGSTWGEIYVTKAAGAAPLTAADVQFMQAICSQLALAIGRAELFSQLVRAAYLDPLTGLANRRAFEERLGEMLAQPDGRRVALLLGDVDGLKELNDAAGHAAGDDALRAVGHALADLGPGRFAARIGGDEFCVVAEGADREEAGRLRAELDARLARGARPVAVSWGLATGRAGDTSPGALLGKADEGQYASKRRGRTTAPPRGDRRRRRHGSGTDAERILALLRDGLELLDATADHDPRSRLEALDALLAGRLGVLGSAEVREAANAAVELLRREARR